MGLWRLFLAWCVVAVHTPGYQDIFSLEMGVVAVSAFFFVSGFLMPLVYETRYQTTHFRTGCLRFFLNRFLRIFPIYWISCLAIVGMTMASFLLHSHEGRVLPPEFGNPVTYLQNFLLIGLNQSGFWGGYFRFNNPAWTLDVELQYYLLVPFIFLAASRFPKWATTILVGLFAGSVYLLLNPAGVVDIDRSFPAWAVFFVLGFVFYRRGFLQKLASFRGVVVVQVVLLTMAYFLPTRSMDTVLVTTSFVIFSAYLLVLQKNYRFGRVDQKIGDLSYPVYILHIAVLGPTAKLLSLIPLSMGDGTPRFFWGLALNIAISTVVAYVISRWIAEPVDRIRSKIRDAGKEVARVMPL